MLLECKHQRWTRRPDLVQMYCFLKRKSCDEKECLSCKYRNSNAKDYKGYQPRKWITQESRGLGDTVAKIIHTTGIARIVYAVTKKLGIDCGCEKRQKKLNKLFPYKGQIR